MAPLPTILPLAEDWIAGAARKLNRAGLFFGHGTDNAFDEAAWLLASACRIRPDRIEHHMASPLLEKELKRAEKLLATRISTRTPAAYLMKESWLSGRRFYVDERVIVPRSFIAELLDEKLSPWIEKPGQVSRVLDLCTGSGCLAVLAARAFRNALVDAVDLSGDALAVAAINVARHRLIQRIKLIESDLFNKVPRRRYDLIITNPPYVDAASMRALPQEYQREPWMALAGGKDGLALAKRIITQAEQYLTPQGLLVMEIGHNQAALEKAFSRTPFTWLDTSGGSEFVLMLNRTDLPR